MALMHPLLTLATLLSIGQAGYTPLSPIEAQLVAIKIKEAWEASLPGNRAWTPEEQKILQRDIEYAQLLKKPPVSDAPRCPYQKPINTCVLFADPDNELYQEVLDFLGKEHGEKIHPAHMESARNRMITQKIKKRIDKEKREHKERVAAEEAEKRHQAELRANEEAINRLASEEASSAQYYARITDADLEALTTRFNQELSSRRMAATSLEKELLASESQARERRGRDAETRDRHNRQ